MSVAQKYVFTCDGCGLSQEQHADVTPKGWGFSFSPIHPLAEKPIDQDFARRDFCSNCNTIINRFINTYRENGSYDYNLAYKNAPGAAEPATGSGGASTDSDLEKEQGET